MEQRLIKVDLFDREIGHISKVEAHEKPILHRAFSVFIYHDNKMLIQRRAIDKYHSGGLWANTCCSHPYGEDDTAAAATRRLEEEMGIRCPIKEIFSFIYLHKFSKDLYEYEFDHVFVGSYDGEICPDAKEIEEVQWVEFDKLEQQLLNNPEKFAAWFITAAPKVLDVIRKDEECI